MDVSTALPFFVAVIDEPLPRWQVMIFASFLPQKLRRFSRDVSVRGAVEPVAPDFVLFVQLVRNGINVSVFPEIGIVGRIEHATCFARGITALAGLKAADRGPGRAEG